MSVTSSEALSELRVALQRSANTPQRGGAPALGTVEQPQPRMCGDWSALLPRVTHDQRGL